MYDGQVFVFHSNLLDVCDPEYQAAARVELMTTSTGTRSATASLEALMVRRIPLPAWPQCNNSDKSQLIGFPHLQSRSSRNMTRWLIRRNGFRFGFVFVCHWSGGFMS